MCVLTYVLWFVSVPLSWFVLFVLLFSGVVVLRVVITGVMLMFSVCLVFVLVLSCCC